jgi:hypothetical protein
LDELTLKRLAREVKFLKQKFALLEKSMAEIILTLQEKEAWKSEKVIKKQ